MSHRHHLKELLRETRKQGWTARMTPGNHYKMTHPAAAFPVYCASSPSDKFALIKIRAMLRRSLAGTLHRQRL